MSRGNLADRPVVVGIAISDQAPTGYDTGTPVDGTVVAPVATSIDETSPSSFKARAAGFIGAMIAVGGVGGMIYGLALLAMYMNSVFQANRRDDLSVGNPMCFDNNAPTLLVAATCSQKKCSDLSTLSAAQAWVNNHPFDLANIDPNQVFNTCLQYMQQCASGSGFLKTINSGQDSEFLADCNHTLTNVGTGFGWIGFALLSLLSMMTAVVVVKNAYRCMSTMFNSSDADDTDTRTNTLDNIPHADLTEALYR